MNLVYYSILNNQKRRKGNLKRDKNLEISKDYLFECIFLYMTIHDNYVQPTNQPTNTTTKF